MLTQKEMGDHGGCSRHTIQSCEIGRVVLSPRIATKISLTTGIDSTWLMNNNPSAPMINASGEPYRYEVDFQPRQRNRKAPDASHYRWRELQLGVALDFFYRLLAANRRKGKEAVDGFMEELERFIKTQLKKHVKLEDAVYGERRRAQEAARKTGGIIPLGFLTPADMKPLQRGREKLGKASLRSRHGKRAKRGVEHGESNLTNESKVCRNLRRHCATNYSHATYVSALS